MTPTARTLAYLRKLGYEAAVVEKWNMYARIRQDLFGCVDVVGIRPDQNGVLGIQATTTSNQAARLAKAMSIPHLRTWLQAGNTFQVWGWAKKGAKGKRKLWEVSIRNVTLAELPFSAAPIPLDEFAPKESTHA